MIIFHDLIMNVVACKNGNWQGTNEKEHYANYSATSEKRNDCYDESYDGYQGWEHSYFIASVHFLLEFTFIKHTQTVPNGMRDYVYIKLQINGREYIVTATSSVKDLGSVIEAATSKGRFFDVNPPPSEDGLSPRDYHQERLQIF